MSGGKAKSDIWTCFLEIKEDKKVKGKCKYCDQIYTTHADRMKKHILLKCKGVPDNIKKKFVSMFFSL